MDETAPGLLELLYQRAAALHGGLYRSGLLRRQALDRFTVSVGGLRFGGAGKTPAVQLLAGPGDAILTRGYGGRSLATPRVAVGEGGDGAPWMRTVAVDGEVRQARDWSGELGDEPALLAATLPAVPVGIHADRAAAAIQVLASHDPRRFLLDDGFSHHRLARDVDLTVLPVREVGSELLLVPGRQREGPASLRRAAALMLLLEGDEHPSPDAVETLREILPCRGPAALVRRLVTSLWRFPQGENAPADTVRGRRALTVAAIGRPPSFQRVVDVQLGVQRVGQRTFRDHHRFSPGELEDVDREARRLGAEIVVSTPKDAIRLPRDWTPSLPWWIVDTALAWDRGREAIEGVVSAP